LEWGFSFAWWFVLAVLVLSVGVLALLLFVVSSFGCC
jgi:hypothetical protein